MKEIEVNGRFVLNRSEGKVMGVAAGLAHWTGIDVLLVRLGLVAALLLTGPVVILFYVLTGWLGADR
jgi:phage shock protein C